MHQYQVVFSELNTTPNTEPRKVSEAEAVYLAMASDAPKGLPPNDPDRVNVVVQINAEVISGARARRRTNRWLLWEIGELLGAGTPELVIKDKLIWRVPVRWTARRVGMDVTHVFVSHIELDAISGELLFDEAAKVKEIHANVQIAARSFPATTD